MSWARTGFELQKKAIEDKKAIEEAAENVGLFGSLGTTLGTIVGTVGGGLLGGLIGAPKMGAAAGAGAGAKLGGEAGKMFASQDDRNILKGEGDQTFYKTDAQQLRKLITDDITKTALGQSVQTFFATEEDDYGAMDDVGDKKKFQTMKEKRSDVLKNIGTQLKNLIDKIKTDEEDKKKPELKTYGNSMMNTSYDSKLEENPFDFNTMRG
tara:strand:+ start:353 stop:982 length:630 start_codon:yes stop_codon:yes gene_type:complete